MATRVFPFAASSLTNRVPRKAGGWRLVAVCAAAVAAFTAGAQGVAAETPRVLDCHDFCYYRWRGAGETFAMVTAVLTNSPALRKKFWDKVASDTTPVIYQLTFPKTPGWRYNLPTNMTVAISAIDEFFAPGDGVTPCPEKLFAVTPSEENIDWAGQVEMQNAIYDHLKNKYGVRTYQWLTEPYKPRLNIRADGWVFDAYHIEEPQKFHAHVESFVLTGVPVVACLWASGHFSKYYPDKSWDELTRFTLERVAICRTLDLPVVLFAVAGRLGQVDLWFKDADNPGERYYRETIKRHLAAIPQLDRPAWKPAKKTWTVASNGVAGAKIDLKKFTLTKETTFGDVHEWKLTSRGLELTAKSGRLSWNLRTVGGASGGRLTLRHSAGAKGRFCGMELSTDGVTEVECEEFDARPAFLEAEAPIALQEISFEGEGLVEKKENKQ